MNFESKYNAALERAKECLQDGTIPAVARDYILEIFTELKESDNEKIRKDLIKYLKADMEYNPSQHESFYKTAIAWLEKQKDVSSIERVFRPIAGCDIADAATQAIEQQQLGYKIVLAFNGAYIRVEEKTTDDIVNEYYSWLEKQGEQKKVSIWKHWDSGIAGNGEGKLIYLIKMGNTYSLSSCLGYECDYIELADLDNLMLEEQGKLNIFDVPKTSIEDAVEVKSRMQYINDDMKPIADFIIGYAHWNLHKDEWNQPTLTVPLFRVLDALIQRGKPYMCEN